jgi:hypothetical protein
MCGGARAFGALAVYALGAGEMMNDQLYLNAALRYHDARQGCRNLRGENFR